MSENPAFETILQNWKAGTLAERQNGIFCGNASNGADNSVEIHAVPICDRAAYERFGLYDDSACLCLITLDALIEMDSGTFPIVLECAIRNTGFWATF